MEKQPSISINLGKDKFEMTRENSSLHSFVGRAALNHIYLIRDDLEQTDDDVLVTPLFRDLMGSTDTWDAIAQQMEAKEFPLYLNHPDVPPDTIDAYEKIALNQMSKEMPDTVPEGWL